ncbi:MAG: glycosyltransferase [Eubacterium sp.]|nr:glycosyltransferase [Eubacterium sp.]
MNKKKVLLTKNLLTMDGATKIVYDLIHEMDKETDDISFDWFLYSPDGHDNVKRFREMGCRIFLDKTQKERKKKSKLLYFATKYIKIIKFLKKQKYDVIHINTDDMFRFDLLIAARIAGVPVRIIHSHNSQGENMKGIRGKKFLQNAAKVLVEHNATELVACSESAAKWMYTKKGAKRAVVLNNGIDVEKYRYNEEWRKNIRHQLGVADNEVLLGNIGRLSEQKNHAFLIKSFAALTEKCPKAKLLIIGEGPLLPDIKAEIAELGIGDRVILIEKTDNANEYYSAMDLFVMTSIHEGLPLVGVEAQAAGLSCVFSDAITRELMISDKVSFLALSEGEDKWAEALEKVIESPALVDRNRADMVRDKGYDITSSAEKLKRLYTRS